MPDFVIDGLDESQLKEVQAEIDRRVTDAVKTNTKKVTDEVTQKVTSELTGEFEAKLESAIKDAKLEASQSDEDKIAQLQKMLDEQKAAFETSQLERKTEQKLREAGMTPEAIEKLTPLIVKGSDAKTLDAQLEAFVSVQQNAIDAALEKQKQTLATNFTPPNTSGGQQAKLSPENQFNAIIGQENVDPHIAGAQAIQFLLDGAAEQ